MASMYTAVADFKAEPIGLQLMPFWQNLAPGTLDRLALQASEDVDRYTKRLLGSPLPGNTVTSLTSSSNPVISVASGINLHQGDVAVVGTESQRVLAVDITDYGVASVGHYPANVTLAAPFTGNYASGTPITFYRQSVFPQRGHSGGEFDPMMITPAAQLVMAHAPRDSYSYGRKLFIPERPVWSIFRAYEKIPIAGNVEQQVDISNAYFDQDRGILEMQPGTYNPESTYWRVVYDAGFKSAPYDIRRAVHLLMAAKCSLNPSGGMRVSGDGQSVDQAGQLFIKEAYGILDNGWVRRGM